MDINNFIEGVGASGKNNHTMDTQFTTSEDVKLGDEGQLANIIRLMQNPMYNTSKDNSYDVGNIYPVESMLKCPKCDYKCIKGDEMEEHMSTHTTEKPFACTECDYRCTLKYNLKQHMFTHTNLWRFSCTQCEYKCRQKEHLKQHMMKHSGEKPFACTVCEYRSLRKGDLKKHMKIHERRVHTNDGFDNPTSLLGYLGSVLKSTQINSSVSHEPVQPKEILVEQILSKFRQSQNDVIHSSDSLNNPTYHSNYAGKSSDNGYETDNTHNGEIMEVSPDIDSICENVCMNNSDSSMYNETINLDDSEEAQNGACKMDEDAPSSILIDHDGSLNNLNYYDRSQDQGVDEYIAEQLADTCLPLVIIKTDNNPYQFDNSHDSDPVEKPSEEDPFKKLEYLFSPNKSLAQDSVDNLETKYNGFQEFDCTFCEYKCYSHTDFVLHVRSHNNKKTYECDKCDYKTSHHYTFKQHTLGHSADEILSCTICEYKCKQKNQLIEHIMNHRGDKPFQCPYCSYSCLRKGDLKRHILIHKGERPFKCPECNNRFKRSNHLKRHLEIHAAKRSMTDQGSDVIENGIEIKDSKRYACEECSYTCTQKVSLVEHMMNHRGEKPYACDICEYKGVRKGDLNKHMLTHTGNKPFTCTECSFSSARRAHLNRHMLTHAENRQDCVICAASFNSDIELKYHLLTHFANNSGFSDDSSEMSNESSTSALDNSSLSDINIPFPTLPFNNIFR
ncbi:unnamed protein product [Meganyctiphanes norvegica]|uniref:Protein hunchback n=1 Tax=Meganyctiphanes norvegica TaxID=48144 RepID=A0AAV2RYW1_MEGNR